jgi:N6-L-threonylcarbamoyladenine synthase
MKILGIETSCDETAVCVLEAHGGVSTAQFTVLGNALYSQIAVHKEYGGVFPALAKREHAKNLVPLLGQALRAAHILSPIDQENPSKTSAEYLQYITNKKTELQTLLEREAGLFDDLWKFINEYERPTVDMITVTMGPGLEPALWVGVNFSKALAIAWNLPVYPINHLEGHVLSPLIEAHQLQKIAFPALSLIISGGHTELVIIKDWLDYEVIGQTKDDAVGEAFDKVARMLDLPYPGGPEISKLAEQFSEKEKKEIKEKYNVAFPRPMISSDNFDFSFSGLKTSVLYFIKKLKETNADLAAGLTPEIKAVIAQEFQNAVTDVLVSKTQKAFEQYGVKNLILGGGVTANTHIRQAFEKMILQSPHIHLIIPPITISTDNAVMIAVAGYFNFLLGRRAHTDFSAVGNLSL